MIKTVEKPREGFERVVQAFDDAISAVDGAMQAEIEQVKQKYEGRLSEYKNGKYQYIVTETIEVPDEQEYI